MLVAKVFQANKSLAKPLHEARVIENIEWAHDRHYEGMRNV
jgi:hypothetical protein